MEYNLRIEYDKLNQIENGLETLVQQGKIPLITYTFYVYVEDDSDYVYVESFDSIEDGYKGCLKWFNHHYKIQEKDQYKTKELFTPKQDEKQEFLKKYSSVNDNIIESLTISCPTEEHAKVLLRDATKHGYHWHGFNTDGSVETLWHEFKEQTVYEFVYKTGKVYYGAEDE